MSQTAHEFIEYAQRDYRGSSPLYEFLASQVAEDSELLEIASHANLTAPNLFFAAVQYLLLRRNQDPLAQYYPSLNASAKPWQDMFPVFRSFCLRYRQEITDIVRCRLVQTNEVSRCAYLYPAFALASDMEANAPLAMIDIGTSAGLHLLWDLYCYDFKVDQLYGNPTSPVRIESAFRGKTVPRFPEVAPRIGSRFGIDLQPVRPEQIDDVQWLEALIWPEHAHRRELFQHAMKMLEEEQNRITLVEGDAAEVLPDVLARVPSEEIPCVFQTHVGRQLSADTKRKLLAAVENFGRMRKIYLVSARKQLQVEYFAPGEKRAWNVANYDQHGRWIEWLQPQE